MKHHFDESAPIRFLFPIDGDCLNERDGCLGEGGAIRITTRIAAPRGHRVTVGGREATERNGVYEAELDVLGYRTTLCARDETAGTQCRATVFRLAGATGGFHLSVEDNILFLADLTEHAEEYASMFEHPYLAVYKKAHDLYGAKVHLHLFYEFVDPYRACFCNARPYFNLSMMTDRFKDEFRANADWLRLSFHSRNEQENPYARATAKEISTDCLLVHREILRFAGKESLSDAATSLHYGAATEEAMRAMRAAGYRVFPGHFWAGAPDPVAYHASTELTAHIHERDFFCDTDADVFFACTDVILNGGTVESNLRSLADTLENPTRGGFICCLMHEQYFYENYLNHLPDYEARVLEPLRFLYERGYRGRFLSDVIREK